MATGGLQTRTYKLYGEQTLVPAIPEIRSNDQTRALAALKEWVEVREGARGNGLDRAVTVRDLLNTGIATPDRIRGLIPGVGEIPTPPGVADPATPPTPTGLVASGAVESIMLTWDFARGYSRLSNFEVWRSAEDTLGTAVKIAQVFEPMYADSVGPAAKFYYWVRAVSDAGISPYNALAGTLGETAIDIGQVVDAVGEEIEKSGLLDQLTVKVNNDGLVSGYGLASTPSTNPNATTFAILADRFVVAGPASAGVVPAPPFFVQTTPTTVNGVPVQPGVYMQDAFMRNGVITNAKIGNLAVDNAKIANVSAAKLTAGALAVGAYIESTNYLAGDTGFRIGGDGNAEFSNATVRGTVFATAGRIGGNTINSTGVQSPGYSASAGWRIDTDGTITANQAKIRGEINIGAYQGWGWPSNGGTGAHLGPNGLLLGNANTGRYLQVTSAGDVYAPKFSIVNGNATFSGSLSAVNGTFSGTLTASNIVTTDNLQRNSATTAIFTQAASAHSSGSPALSLWTPSFDSSMVCVVNYGSYWRTSTAGAVVLYLYVDGVAVQAIRVGDGPPDPADVASGTFSFSFAFSGNGGSRLLQIVGGLNFTLENRFIQATIFKR